MFWGIGLVPLAMGIAFQWWLAIGLGVFVLGTYVQILVSVVRFNRRSPMSVGVIRELRPLSRLLGLSTTGVRLANGEVVQAQAVTRPAQRMLDQHGSIEVLVLADRAAQQALIIGMRPVVGEVRDE